MQCWTARGALALACMLACTQPSVAQSVTTAAVSGIVADASGAPVPGARITSVYVERNQEFETVAGPGGRFRLSNLPVGRHRLTIELDGFRPVLFDLALDVGEALDLPVTLSLAGVTETVAVKGAIVEVARTAVAERVSPEEVDRLPLNGRNYLDLALLAPGVSRTITKRSTCSAVRTSSSRTTRSAPAPRRCRRSGGPPPPQIPGRCSLECAFSSDEHEHEPEHEPRSEHEEE